MGKEQMGMKRGWPSETEVMSATPEYYLETDLLKQWGPNESIVRTIDVVEDGHVVVTIKTNSEVTTLLCTRFDQEGNTCAYLAILLRLKGIIPRKAVIQGMYLHEGFVWTPLSICKDSFRSGDHILLIVEPLESTPKPSIKKTARRPRKSSQTSTKRRTRTKHKTT